MMSEINQQTYQNIILGLGLSGVSVARFLQEQDQEFIVMDTRAEPPGQKELFAVNPATKLIKGKFDQGLLNNAKRLIVNPGLSIKEGSILKAKNNGVEIIGDIELFARSIKQQDVKLVGITGSNGKSTVASLVQTMILDAGFTSLLGGNIGIPALDLLTKEKPAAYVLELSSFQLETTDSLECDVAAVLNICEDHLDRYVDFAAYVKAKQKLASQTKALVILQDDVILKSWKKYPGIKHIGITSSNPFKAAEFGTRLIADELWLVKGSDKLIPAAEIYLKGKHNVLNSLTALAIGFELDLSLPDMQKTLKEFKGLAHRTQLVRKKAGVSWINDSKGTNVGATIAAIESLAGKNNIVLLAGGQSKEGDFAKLAVTAKGRVKQAILFGEDARAIAEHLKKTVKYTVVDSFSDVVKLADEIAVAGDTVLFSPACASFDMFKNYVERGEHFVSLVENLP